MKRLIILSIIIQISIIISSAQSSIVYDKRANQKTEYVFSAGDTIRFFPLNPSFKGSDSNRYTCFYDIRCLKHGIKAKYRFAANDNEFTPNGEIENSYFLVKSINDAEFNEKNKLHFSALLERLEDSSLVYFAFPKDLKKEPKESVLHSWVVTDLVNPYSSRTNTALVIPFLTKKFIDIFVSLEGKKILFRDCYKEEDDTESHLLEFANGKVLAGDLLDRDCIYEIGHEFIANKFHFMSLGDKLNYSQPLFSVSDSISKKSYEIPVSYFAGNINRIYVIRGNTPNLLSKHFVDKEGYKSKLQLNDTMQYEHLIGKNFYFDAGYTYEQARNFVFDETRSYKNPNYRYRLRKGFYKCLGFDYFQPVNSSYLNFKKYVIFEDSLEQKFIFPIVTDYRQYNVHVKDIYFTEMFELESVKQEKDRIETEKNERLRQFVSKYGEDLGFALWVGKCSEERYLQLCKKYGKRKAGLMARQLYEVGWTFEEFCEAKSPNIKCECIYTHQDGFGYYEVYKYGHTSHKYITFRNSVIISISDYYE